MNIVSGLWQGIGVMLILVLVSCAPLSELRPGVATVEAVQARLGPPAMEWRDGDGGRQLAYPQGPSGFQTIMVHIRPDGRLRLLENVLDAEHFALIRPGISDHAYVIRLLGPPMQVTNFDRRNEQAWEWRFRDVWTYPARFIVTFDKATGIVKERYDIREYPWHGLVF